MNKSELIRQAQQLANRPYLSIVRYEPEGNGTPDYIAYHPDLPGCMAQGETKVAARAALDEARLFWIQCLLEDGLPVPDPQPLGGTIIETAGGAAPSPVSVGPGRSKLTFQPA